MYFKCRTCGKEYDYGLKIWKCQCGGYLKLVQNVKFAKKDIVANKFNMWRYAAAYPINYGDLSATFDEGLTPLAPVNWDNVKIHVKLDSLMPTGSFKDRGMVMAVNYLAAHGAEYITEDSSGNAAASVAAYCGAASVKCRVFVPAGNSSGKIIQSRAYGAEINEVPGSRDEVAQAAQIHASSYAGHNWHPVFAAGLKSIAYEIWEQSGFSAPDIVVSPCGGGSLVLGLVDGFTELLENGQINRLPKIIAVQPENCNPIYRRFISDNSNFSPKPTIAEGTSIARPVKPDEIVDGVKATGGVMVSIGESDIKPALLKACASGVYIEPTSAIAFAAISKLLESGFTGAGENIVVVATGSGLKAGDTIGKILS